MGSETAVGATRRVALAAPATSQVRAGLSWRAVVLGALLVPVNSYWILYMQVCWNQGYTTMLSLMSNVVYILFLLVLASLAVRRIAPRLALRQAELLTIFVMLSIGSCFTQYVEYLMPIVVYAPSHADGSNHWGQIFLSRLPDWLTVREPAAASAYFVGQSAVRPHLAPWLIPLGAWTVFILLVFAVITAIGIIARRQWSQYERLSYPIVQLPMEITGETGAVFANWPFWIGFAASAFLVVWNTLAYSYPFLPTLPVKRNVLQPFAGLGRPWNAMGEVVITSQPFIVGLGFLLPLDLLFSSWFFYWFTLALRLVGAIMGYEGNPKFPYQSEQCFGAWVGLFAVALWAARRNLRRIFAYAWSRLPALDDRDEPLGYRAAVILGAVAFVGLILFLLAARMSLLIAVAALVIYFVVTTAMAKARAAFGPPTVDLFLTMPDRVLAEGLGTRVLGADNLVMLSELLWATKELSWHPLPHQLEGYRMASLAHINLRRLLVAMVLGGLVAWFFSLWLMLHFGYRVGVSSAAMPGQTQDYYGREAFDLLAARLSFDSRPDPQAAIAMAFGLGLTLALSWAGLRSPNWPLHPVGYALAGSYGMSLNGMWWPLLVAWVIKVLVMRYFGLRGYRAARPLFIGLILGEFLVGSTVMIAGVAVGRQVYAFWPY